MRFRIIASILLCLSLLSFKGDNNFIERDGTDYAVFFAVKDYYQWDDLRTPIKDAQAIAKVLRNKYDFKTEILENPTKIEIQKKIAEFQKKHFKKDDQLLIFFTGHGEFIPSNYNPDEGKGYFIPSDAKKDDPFRGSYLYYPDIKPDINDIDCQHIMIVIDACFSGSFLQYRDSGDERPGLMNDRDRLIKNSLEKRCRKGITSGGLKRTRDGVYHSPFTDKFLAGLNSLGGEDQVLTYNELYSKLEGLQDAPRRGYFGYEDSESKFLFIAKQQKINNQKIANSAQRQADLNAWQIAENGNTIETYRIYLSSHPSGLFASRALQKILEIEEETDWQIASVLNTSDSYQEYIDKYPNGKNRTEASRLRAVVKDSTKDFSGASGTFIDSRDGQVYKWIEMKDGKTWMAENLNYKTPESYCYDNNESYCKEYGRLYSWQEAKKACPSGWYLPSDEGWKKLIKTYGGYIDSEDDGKDNGNPQAAYNSLISSEFSALLGGYRSSFGSGTSPFMLVGEIGTYWSRTESGSGGAWNYHFEKPVGKVLRGNGFIDFAFSCRCIKD